jgi:uncharacterized membrane protein
MSPAIVTLIAASVAFVGTHVLLSHPLRAPLANALGEKGFLGLYSLVALGSFLWMVHAFGEAPAGDLGGSGIVGWIFASLLTIPALVLFLGSLWKNPALPKPGAKPEIARTPRGVFAVTRHPMMWGFALWAIAHIALWWDVRTLIVAGSVLFLALVGASLQDLKKERLMADAWLKWEVQTSYWPRWGALKSVNPLLWLLALAVWLGATWWHIHAAGIPAGIWRWV